MHNLQAWRNWKRLAMIFVVGLAPAIVAAQEEGEGAAEPAPKIEIRGIGGGGFGGIGLPKEFEAMMKAAQELQTLQTKYQSSVDELIAAAKALEQADNLMDSVTKVAKLAKKSEEIKAEIAKKQEEMTKKIGGGAIGIGGFGFGGAIEGGGVKILPVAPKVQIEIEGIELEAPAEED